MRSAGYPPGRRDHDPGDEAEQGGFAAAVRALQADQPSSGNLLADVADDPGLPKAIPLTDRDEPHGPVLPVAGAIPPIRSLRAGHVPAGRSHSKIRRPAPNV